jgi:hypothetical protein
MSELLETENGIFATNDVFYHITSLVSRVTMNKREKPILYFLWLRINVFRNLIDMVKTRFVFF